MRGFAVEHDERVYFRNVNRPEDLAEIGLQLGG